MNRAPHLRIAFFHGLESQGPGTKGEILQAEAAELYAPRVDYRNETEVQRIWKEAVEFAPDVVVGSSMGGWFACHLSTVIDVPAMLVNPAVVGRSFDPIPLELGGHRPITHVLLGKLDETISGEAVLAWMKGCGMKPADVDWVDEGHRISKEAFESWSHTGLYRIAKAKQFDSSEFEERMEQDLKLGPLEQSLACAVRRKFYTKDAICTYSGGGLKHGQESAHRRWVEGLEVIENQQDQVIVNVHEAMSALKDLKARLTEAEGEPDWTDPRVRKEMTKAMRSITRVGTIGISSFPNRRAELIPQLSAITYHDALAFYEGKIYHIHLKENVGQILEQALWDLKRTVFSVDFNALDAPNPRQFNRVSWMAIPKHIDGSAPFAVTAEMGEPRARDRTRRLHFWKALPDKEWAYDGAQSGTLERM